MTVLLPAKLLDDYGLHQCKDVLGAVVYLMRQKFLPLLRQLSFGNVPGDLGRSNDLTRRILDRRYAEGNIDQSSILAPTDSFIMARYAHRD